MIDGIEQLYQEIAESMVLSLDEIEWTSARFEVIYYPGCSVYEAEYTRKVDGKARSLSVFSSGIKAFDRLRQLFKDAGKPLWGRACFELSPSGQFHVTWGYDGCDADGNAIFDADLEFERETARNHRLTRP
jgi:hypothetical protein